MTDENFPIQLTFDSRYFKPVDGEEDETTPGCLGKSLALWLAAELRQRGVEVLSVQPEDFGWIVVITRAPAWLFFCCANVTGTTDQWTVFLAMERSLLARLMRRPVPRDQIAALKQHLTDIAVHIPQASNVIFD